MGRYGAYLSYRNENFRLPKGTDPLNITIEEAWNIIVEAGTKKTRGKKKKSTEPEA